MGRQGAPLADGQMAQHHIANAHPLQTHHFEPDQLAHAADLALFAFAPHHPQLLWVLPLDFGMLQWLAVQTQAVAQQLELVGGEHRLHVGADRVVVVKEKTRVVFGPAAC